MKPKNPRPASGAQEPDYHFSLEQIASALFVHAGIKSGLWRVAAKLRFAAITAGMPSATGEEEPRPAGVMAIDGLALFKAEKPGQLVFDAAAVSSPLGAKATPAAKRRASRARVAAPAKTKTPAQK